MKANSGKRCRKYASQNVLWLFLLFVHGAWAGSARAQEKAAVQSALTNANDLNAAEPTFEVPQSDLQAPGSISGKVVDQSGAAVGGARVTLAREGQSQDLEVLTDGAAVVDQSAGAFR